jgi:hypothetical protein
MEPLLGTAMSADRLAIIGLVALAVLSVLAAVLALLLGR